MNYRAYKMEFLNGVHLGNRTIENSEYTFHADTLFSALCQEAIKNSDEMLEKLYTYAKNGEIILSDAFPYCGDILYIPKPLLKVEYEKQGDSTVKKAFKNLTYIPADKIMEYRKGQLDIRQEQAMLDDLGTTYSRAMTAVRGKTDALPYRVGVVRFRVGNGLYFIVGYCEEQQIEFIEMLLDQLSFSGIGGKRSSGLGRFELKKCKLPNDMIERLTSEGNEYMTLSVALPNQSEIHDVIPRASCQMIKRSGFVASDKYSKEYLRKKDLYVMNAGACVKQIFSGDIYDVSSQGKHPVYRYAKPMLLEVDL